jgi:prophage antirepressor-like protein
MNNLPQIFNFQSSQVRVVVQDGEPWFVAKDVCEVLELGNPSQALTRLDDDEKGVISNDTPGGFQEMLVVNEYGLYSLVLGSRKPEAKSFKRWITHEVIPAIRKNGSYSTQPVTPTEALLQAVQILAKQEKDIKTLQIVSEQTQQQIQNIKEAIITTDKDWRRDTNKKLQRIGFKTGDYQGIKNESYELLEKRGRCNLDRRLENLRSRLRDAAATKTQINNANYLDVVDMGLSAVVLKLISKMEEIHPNLFDIARITVNKHSIQDFTESEWIPFNQMVQKLLDIEHNIAILRVALEKMDGSENKVAELVAQHNQKCWDKGYARKEKRPLVTAAR